MGVHPGQHGAVANVGRQDRIIRMLDATSGTTIFTSPTGNGKVTAVLIASTGTLLAWAN
jgi:hypothetical protein